MKVADRLRATFSRSITMGVAATFNNVVRRLQLAAANAVAFTMIPPVPPPVKDRSRLLNPLSQLVKAYTPLIKVSTQRLSTHLTSIISRDSVAEAVPEGNVGL